MPKIDEGNKYDKKNCFTLFVIENYPKSGVVQCLPTSRGVFYCPCLVSVASSPEMAPGRGGEDFPL